MARNDYYVLLGVAATASRTQIRRAFRKLARKYHPDINPGDNVAAVHYQRIAEAFEVLVDPERRERYDSIGAEPEAPPQTEPARYGFEGFDFSLEERREVDIFPDLFRRPAASSDSHRLDGEDIHHRLSISFKESLRGLESRFRVGRQVSCETCEGFGDIPASQPRPCTACGGRGRTTQTRGFMLFAKPCEKCRGAGMVERERCPDCAGGGRATEEQTISVAIPAGVSDGDKISVPGMGNQGRGAGRPGDLYIHIQVQPDTLFSRKGDNLFCTVPVSFTEAALGAKLDVPTPDGEVTLRVPAGVQSGQKLKLSGRGAPSRRSAGGRGDLFVVVQVVTPTVYDDRSRELLRELDRLNPMEARESLRMSREGART
ncbi:MAG: J domain-containing protein [Acidobacteria bacterium]|nr:MAG: J domain-containing protein [Acidobacteriota bacterium]